jgi:hypothetical protein
VVQRRDRWTSIGCASVSAFQNYLAVIGCPQGFVSVDNKRDSYALQHGYPHIYPGKFIFMRAAFEGAGF